MKQISKGENVIIRRNLLKVDGSDLLLEDITSLLVDVMQSGTIISSYTLPEAYLREVTGQPSTFELEISTVISAKFRKGKVSARYTIVSGSTVFSGEGIQKDIIEEEILNVS